MAHAPDAPAALSGAHGSGGPYTQVTRLRRGQARGRASSLSLHACARPVTASRTRSRAPSACTAFNYVRASIRTHITSRCACTSLGFSLRTWRFPRAALRFTIAAYLALPQLPSTTPAGGLSSGVTPGVTSDVTCARAPGAAPQRSHSPPCARAAWHPAAYRGGGAGSCAGSSGAAGWRRRRARRK